MKKNRKNRIAAWVFSFITIVFCMSITPVFGDAGAFPAISAIAAGGSYTVAIGEDGSLWAWGINSMGQLGDGTNIQRDTPVRIGADADWVSVFAGTRHTFAIRQDGSLWAWGDNRQGQLGDGTTTSRNTPVQVMPPAGGYWLSVSGGSYHGVGIIGDSPSAAQGRIVTWGDNYHSSLGDTSVPYRLIPEFVGTYSDWTVASAGRYHTMAIRNDTLWAWGRDFTGQLGVGGSGDYGNRRAEPTQVGTGTNWTYIVAANFSSFGVRIGADAGLWIMGSLNFDGTRVDTPKRISSANNWLSIDSSTDSNLPFAVAIKDDGTLWTMGSNGSGQLGDGTTITDWNSFAQIGESWKSVTAGSTHAAALRDDGSLWVWGANSFGQLGNGRSGISEVSRVPIRIMGQGDVGGQPFVTFNSRIVRAHIANSGEEIAPGTQVPTGTWVVFSITTPTGSVVSGNWTVSGTNRGLGSTQLSERITDDARVTFQWLSDGLTTPSRLVTVTDSFAGIYNYTSSISSAGSHRTGKVVTVHAGERSGYYFSHWTSVPVNLNWDGDGALQPSGSFLMPTAENVRVWANWSDTLPAIVHTVNFSASSSIGGSVAVTRNGSPIASGGTLVNDDVLLFVATPSNGYLFSHWLWNGSLIPWAPNRFFEVEFYSDIASIIDVQAIFAIDPDADDRNIVTFGSNVTAFVPGQGQLANGMAVPDGTWVVFNAYPGAGNRVDIWTVMGSEPPARSLQWNNVISISVNQDTNATVTTASLAIPSPHIIPRTITVNGSSAGAGATGAGVYAQGQSATVHAGPPAPGMRFNGWATIPAGVLTAGHNNPTVTFTVPTSNVTFTAHWIADDMGTELPPPQPPPTYAITIIDGGMGASASSNPATEGANVTLNAGTPPEGQVFSHWSVVLDTISISNSTSATRAVFQMIAAPVTLMANWSMSTAFVPVSTIFLSPTTWRIGEPVDLNKIASILPWRPQNTYPAVNDIIWTAVSTQLTWGSTLEVSIDEDSSVLITSGEGQGTVLVRAVILRGGHNRLDIRQYFTLTFAGQGIEATLEGLESLYTGRKVNAQVLFALDSGAFADEIFPQDFFVGNLPSGLRAEEAERISNTVVSVRITGSPNLTITSGWSLSVPSTIPARNVRRAIVAIPVFRRGLDFGEVTASATVWPGAFTFDINPYVSQRKNVSVNLQPRGMTLRNIRYGNVVLQEDSDYTRNFNYNFVLHTSFLERLPVGQWELTFHMSRGANPTIVMNIFDTSQVKPLVQQPAGSPPVLPKAPIHPDENFMYLTGGIAVNMKQLRWDLNRARVTPEVHGGVAEVTVRTHVLDYLSGTIPGESFEIITPMVRVRVPVDILDLIFGGRLAIIQRGLFYDQADLRISIIDRSEDELVNYMFSSVYPMGKILSPVVQLLVELVETETGEVILTAQEFTRPIERSFVVMNNAGHLRPAGVMFQWAWLEFVPYRSFSSNEITTSSIFPGIKGVVHNRAHFEDVYLMHWGFVQSYTAAYSGLVVPSEHLHPDTVITRGEFAQLLSFALQMPRAGANVSGFVDVLTPNVFFDGVSRLFAAKLLGLYVSGNEFHPNAVITREEIAAITGMAIILGEPVRPSKPRPLELAFTDFVDFNPHHITNIQETVNFGVMVGYPDNTFRPREPATRIYALEAVINLARALGLLDKI